jgi:glucose-1-phosphate thymidylyltransferase
VHDRAARVHTAGEIVGLIPAAGRATRVAPLPCSKEILPVGLRRRSGSGAPRLVVACQPLIESMRSASAEKIFVVLRAGKWDIPQYLGDVQLGVALAYVTIADSPGPPFSLDRAYPFVKDATVLFGFPDILIRPEEAHQRLLARLAVTGADIVLGLYPTHDPRGTDMVALAPDGSVRDLLLKPEETGLTDTWITAVWTPAFTAFLHDYIAAAGARLPAATGELSVGHVIQAAIRSGRLRAHGIPFPDGDYLDIGTPEGMARALSGGF